MKGFVCLVLFVGMGFAQMPYSSYFDPNFGFDKLWDNFKKIFNKDYAGENEKAIRSIWEKNMADIIQHNLDFEKGLSSFTKAMNEFADMGYCGSCWAFSSIGALEGQYQKKYGQLVSFSEQNLVDCSRHEGNHGCNGGIMDQAFVYIKRNGGIASEESYPYLAKDDTCKYKSSTSKTTITGFVVIPPRDESALQTAVATIGPISVGIHASQLSFRFYGGGIYNELTCSSTYLDHGVLVVGYGNENGQDYWLIKNSWGTTWGESGYAKMSRNKHNQCGIATHAIYPLI